MSCAETALRAEVSNGLLSLEILWKVRFLAGCSSETFFFFFRARSGGNSDTSTLVPKFESYSEADPERNEFAFFNILCRLGKLPSQSSLTTKCT